MKRIIAFLILILTLIGCNGAPPEGWYMPGNSVSTLSKQVVLKASDPNWQYVMRYDKQYNYTIKVFSAYPSFNSVPGGYSAIASGTASFCNYRNDFSYDSSSYRIPPIFESLGYFGVNFSKSGCSGTIKNSEGQTINDIYLGSVPHLGFTCDDSTCCVGPGYYETFGCNAINGVPQFDIGGSDNIGRVAYAISTTDTPPAPDAGTPITGPITSVGPLAVGVSTTASAPQSGYLWLKIIDHPGDYKDNYGQYEVSIEYPEQESSFISNIASAVITPITSQVRAVSIQFWQNFVNSNTTRSIIATMMLLYIMVMGISVVMGSTKFSQKELVVTTLKFGILTALISPLSYDFFNQYLFQLFVEGQADLINAITTPNAHSLNSGVVNYNSAFAFTNYVVNTLFSMRFFTVLVSFLFWFPIGWFCIILVFLAFIEYTIAIIEAFVLYLVATTAVQLLISMGPIFISLILFERTRTYFNKWIGAIISFAMQPVILFASIMLITNLIFGVLSNIMSIKIQWSCVQEIYLNLGPDPFNNDEIIKIHLGCLYWFNPIANMMDVIRDSLIFYLLVRLIKQVTSIATEVTSYIFGGGEMLGGAGQIASSVGSSIRSAMKKELPKKGGKKQDDGKKKDEQKGDKGKQSRPGAGGDKGISVSKPEKPSGGGGSGVSVSGSGGGSISIPKK